MIPGLGQHVGTGFNPRTRVGCDGPCVCCVPARCSFNPRTRVGCDARSTISTAARSSFNPRTRVGCDVGGGSWTAWHSPVSIHAPAWGATRKKMLLTFDFNGFNPRTRVGFDCRHPPRAGTVQGFQSTHPRGVRPLQPTAYTIQFEFQSTHPRGVRHGVHVRLEHGQGVSIHAPAWGATPRLWTTMGSCTCFNPRTRVGCDCFHVLSSRFP